jgi:hypothetical protein
MGKLRHLTSKMRVWRSVLLFAPLGLLILCASIPPRGTKSPSITIGNVRYEDYDSGPDSGILATFTVTNTGRATLLSDSFQVAEFVRFETDKGWVTKHLLTDIFSTTRGPLIR